MTALPPLSAPTGEAPAGFPQSSRQGFNLSQASARALIAYPNGDAVVSKSYFSHYS